MVRLYSLLIFCLFFAPYPKDSFAAHGIPKGVELSLYAGLSEVETRINRMVLSSLETDTFKGDAFSNEPLWGGGIGFTYIEEQSRRVLFGVDVFHFDTNHTGQVWQYGLPAFNNYRYTLDVKSTRVMLFNQWEFATPLQKVKLFAKAGMGLAVNRSGYNDRPINPIPDGHVRLSNKSSNEFAYDIGGGIKIPFSKHLAATLQYQYADLGDFDSSRSGNIVLLKPIHIKLRSQSVIAGLSYTIS